jgi:hypothetical protein
MYGNETTGAIAVTASSATGIERDKPRAQRASSATSFKRDKPQARQLSSATSLERNKHGAPQASSAPDADADSVHRASGDPPLDAERLGARTPNS